LKLLILVLEL